MTFSRPAGCALVLLLGLVVFTACLRLISRSMIYPGSPFPMPSEAELSRRFPHAQLVEYQTEDGARLVGALFQRPGSTAPVVVHFHGNGESAAHNLDYAADLFRRGLDVFVAEYRGFGGLPGKPTETHLYRDGEAAVDALLKSGIAPERLVFVGRSLGSGVATEMALRRPCALLVLISPYTSMVDMGRIVAGPLAAFAVPDRYDNLQKIGRVQVPVVILHGVQDEAIPIRMGRRLASASPKIKLVEVPGASHNVFPDLEEILAREILEIAAGGLAGPPKSR
ncbi:MAG TPA: alpha/beta hydrolase [Thermoanaerobaculia bacterium]